MEVPLLIKLVQNYPELYDVNHPNYFNNARREVIWEEIGAALNKPSNECKDRWAKVRDNHRKALKRRRSRSSVAAKHSKPPRYGKELSFLAAHLIDDPPATPTNYATASDDDSTTILNEDDDHRDAFEIINGNFQQNYDEDSRQSPTATNIPTFNLWDLASATLETQPAKKRTRVEVSEDVVANVLEDYLVNKTSTATQDNSLLTFFVSMAKTVHSFPVRDQIEMKRKVFQLISDREMEIALRNIEQPTTSAVGLEGAELNVKQKTK